MKLIGYWRSSATYRVRIALALKGLDVDYQSVNLMKGEQESADYLSKNPAGRVPCLITDEGAVLTQSLAIMEYLEEIHPNTSILPGGPVAKAQARAIAAQLACEAQPFGNLSVQKYLRKERGFDDAAMKEWMNRFPGRAMEAVEAMVARTAGDFCIGDTPTIADCCLAPQMYAAGRFGVDVSAFRKLNEINDCCLRHPAFQKAHPDNQPDAVR